MLAIYRKYRPATFESLLGQELTVKILKEAAKQDRLSHAYLLSGPRGTGKTTTARLIAKIANCETRAKQLTEAPTPKGGRGRVEVASEPCNKCGPCTEINLSLIHI